MASFSTTSQKFKAKPVKTTNTPKGPSHSQLAARWAAQGGKFVETKRVWTKAEINAARSASDKGTFGARAKPSDERVSAGVVEDDEDDDAGTDDIDFLGGDGGGGGGDGL